MGIDGRFRRVGYLTTAFDTPDLQRASKLRHRATLGVTLAITAGVACATGPSVWRHAQTLCDQAEFRENQPDSRATPMRATRFDLEFEARDSVEEPWDRLLALQPYQPYESLVAPACEASHWTRFVRPADWAAGGGGGEGGGGRALAASFSPRLMRGSKADGTRTALLTIGWDLHAPPTIFSRARHLAGGTSESTSLEIPIGREATVTLYGPRVDPEDSARVTFDLVALPMVLPGGDPPSAEMIGTRRRFTAWIESESVLEFEISEIETVRLGFATMAGGLPTRNLISIERARDEDVADQAMPPRTAHRDAWRESSEPDLAGRARAGL